MSKTSACITMLELLNSNKTLKISELADILDSNPRNIPEYKKELELAGYEIKVTPGPYGGYSLNSRKLFSSANLSESDFDALSRGYKYLIARNDFMYKGLYSKAMGKILSEVTDRIDQEKLVSYRFPLTMDTQDIEERYNAVSLCIERKRKLLCDYQSLNGTFAFRLDPYRLFMYNNAWFFLAFDHYRKDVGFFKINRITNYTISDERYAISPYFHFGDYVDDLGMKAPNDTHRIVLEFTGAKRILLEERQFGRNQTVEERDGKLILTVDMRNWWEIIKFVLAFGAQVRVLEPQKLIEDIKKEVNKMYAVVNDLPSATAE